MAEEDSLTAPDTSSGNVPVGAAVPPTPTGTNEPAQRSPRLPLRVFDWFWRGKDLKRLRRTALDSPAVEELGLRARLLFELGERASNPAEPLPRRADAVAAELYRQSAYFGVRALASAGETSHEGALAPWSTLPPTALRAIAGSEAGTEAATRLVEDGDFLEPWQLPKEQQALRAQELARIARAVLGELAWRKRARDALWIQRLLRLSLLLLLVALVAFGVRWLNDRSERGRDLAVGRAWRTSSTAPGLGCASPQQQCGENSDFFFHTNEERNPWIEIDLGKPMRFSAVRVENRKDCCFDRAAPLVVEVSNQQDGFRPVARRETTFGSWLATFPPTEARYVRLRVDSRGVMHLSQIRVLR